MAVRMVLSLYPERKLSSLRILDTCCGTGGFLVSCINHLRRFLTRRETAKGGSAEAIAERVHSELKDMATRNITGWTSTHSWCRPAR